MAGIISALSSGSWGVDRESAVMAVGGGGLMRAEVERQSMGRAGGHWGLLGRQGPQAGRRCCYYSQSVPRVAARRVKLRARTKNHLMRPNKRDRAPPPVASHMHVTRLHYAP